MHSPWACIIIVSHEYSKLYRIVLKVGIILITTQDINTVEEILILRLGSIYLQ